MAVFLSVERVWERVWVINCLILSDEAGGQFPVRVAVRPVLAGVGSDVPD